MAQPSLSHLAIFLAVARCRSFQRAAVELNLSTSAISHAIRNLEERLSLSLFNRTTRSVALTEAGEHLYSRLEPLLDGVTDAIDEVNKFRDRPAGRLRINTSRVAAHIVIAPLLAPFTTAFPEISLEIVDDNSMIDIVGSGFDAGLRFPGAIPDDMVAVSLGISCRFAVVASPAWLASNAPLVHPMDLRGHECVCYRFPSGRLFRWEFEKDGEEIEVNVVGRITVGDQDLAIKAAVDGVGPAIVFENAARVDLSQKRLVRVLEDWCKPFPGPLLYYPQQRRISAALRAFIEMARNYQACGPGDASD